MLFYAMLSYVMCDAMLSLCLTLCCYCCSGQYAMLQRARFDGVGTAIGLTANQVLNNVFVTRAREFFGVSHCYAAIDQPDLGLAPELVASEEVRMLFDGPHEVERWDVRARHDALDVERWRFVGAGESGEDVASMRSESDLFVLLCVLRTGHMHVMHRDFEIKADDEVSVAIHLAEREQAHAVLRRRGFEASPPELPG